MTMATKREIFSEKLEEYLRASKEGKGRILDAACRITGGNRKAAIRRFRTLQMRPRQGGRRRGRKTIYGLRLVPLIRGLWELSGRICAERLHPIIPEYIRVLKRDRMWEYDEERTGLLLWMSAGTLKDRIDMMKSS